MKKLFIIKAWVLFVLLLSMNHTSFGQDAVAMLKFEDAEKAYNAGDYPKVLQALEEVEELVGVTSKTLYLRIVSQNELFAGGSNLYDGPEQFQLLSGLREHTTTYLDAMGSQGLDDKYRTVYRIRESLANFPITEQEWQAAYEREEAKKIRKEYHANGQLKSVGKVEDGKKNGEWKYYYDNGELASFGLYRSGIQKGVWDYYNKDGILVKQQEYDSDNAGGYVLKMYFENGQLASVAGHNAKHHGKGEFKEFYENGQLKKKGTYTGYYASRIGKYKAYHENGQLWVDAEYNDKFQFTGWYREYYANGQPAVVGNYVGDYGSKVGVWKYFHDNGELEKVENYPEEGQLDGEVKAYYKSGKLKSLAQYDNGDRISFREYYESGQLSLTVLPEDEGYWKYYHENGQLKGFGKFVTEKGQYRHGKWKSYHENGQPAKIENYDIGHLDDSWKSYYSNGRLKEEGKYKYGGKDGKWEAYFENGQLKEKGRYKSVWQEYSYMDNKSYKVSKWTYYHPNGEVKAKGKYKDGEKVGNWEYFDEQGNRIN